MPEEELPELALVPYGPFATSDSAPQEVGDIPVWNGNGYDFLTHLTLTAPNASTSPLVVQGAVGQTANLLTVKTSASVDVFKIGPTGTMDNPTTGVQQTTVEIDGFGKGTATVAERLQNFYSYIADKVGVANKTITGAANNGSGLIRITAASHGYATGDRIAVYGVVGTTEANGAWTVTVINANTFDLQGSTFTNAYVSGGTSTNRPMLYAGSFVVGPSVDRGGLTGTAANGDDVAGVVVFNGGIGKATDAYYLGRNSSSFPGTTPEWATSIALGANSDYGILFGGAYGLYGIDFVGFSATYQGALMRLPNNEVIVGRNAAGTLDVDLMRMNTSNQLQFDAPITASTTLARFTGAGSPVGPAATEIGFDGSGAFLLGFNRDGGTYQAVRVEGLSVSLKSGSTTLVSVDSNGIGFYGTTPVAKPTGVAVTAAGIHAALVTLGLIAA